MTRTYKSVKVSPELHQELRILAAIEGENIMDMLKALITSYKENNKNEQKESTDVEQA